MGHGLCRSSESHVSQSEGSSVVPFPVSSVVEGFGGGKREAFGGKDSADPQSRNTTAPTAPLRDRFPQNCGSPQAEQAVGPSRLQRMAMAMYLCSDKRPSKIYLAKGQQVDPATLLAKARQVGRTLDGEYLMLRYGEQPLPMPVNAGIYGRARADKRDEKAKSGSKGINGPSFVPTTSTDSKAAEEKAWEELLRVGMLQEHCQAKEQTVPSPKRSARSKKSPAVKNPAEEKSSRKDDCETAQNAPGQQGPQVHTDSTDLECATPREEQACSKQGQRDHSDLDRRSLVLLLKAAIERTRSKHKAARDFKPLAAPYLIRGNCPTENPAP